MRIRPETLLIVVMSLFAATGVVALLVMNADPVEPPVVIDPVRIEPVLVEPAVEPFGAATQSGEAWFQAVRAHCNPVEVETRLRRRPAPESEDGSMYEAACLALAGKIDGARAAIERLPAQRRYLAAGVVFEAGHPVADAGDDLAAGPLMELVVEYWPNHYMALYHAGAAAFDRGELGEASEYLERFLVEYPSEDGWRSDALAMLASIRS